LLTPADGSLWSSGKHPEAAPGGARCCLPTSPGALRTKRSQTTGSSQRSLDYKPFPLRNRCAPEAKREGGAKNVGARTPNRFPMAKKKRRIAWLLVAHGLNVYIRYSIVRWLGVVGTVSGWIACLSTKLRFRNSRGRRKFGGG